MRSSDAPIPVLNTRMKNLSQFSFKNRDNEITTALKLKEEKRRRERKTCTSYSRTCFQSIFFSLLLLSIVLVLALVLSSPQALTSYYDVAFLPDVRPESKPSLAFCWPMPFAARRLQNLGNENITM